MIRCKWAGDSEPYVSYHDKEWGVPLHDDQQLFEMLNLEGAQAGLSWITILKKRPHYRKVFDGFNPRKIANYTDQKISSLLEDPGIVRNKLKVNAVRSNAKAYLEIVDKLGSFDSFIWQFVEGTPIINHWKHIGQVPVKTEISDQMSKSLKKAGFKFVGSTICYAYMQAIGMVNDHTTDCFRWQACQ